MTFTESEGMRKKATTAEMKLAGVTPNEQTQYAWLYPGGLVIESTEGWNDQWLGMYYLLAQGREYFKDGDRRHARVAMCPGCSGWDAGANCCKVHLEQVHTHGAPGFPAGVLRAPVGSAALADCRKHNQRLRTT